MQENRWAQGNAKKFCCEGASSRFVNSPQIEIHYGKYNLKTWLKVDGMELSSIDECKKYLGNNLPNNDFVRAFFFNSTGKIGLFRRFFTDPIPGYYLTTDTIAVDLLVQVGFHFSSLIHWCRPLSNQYRSENPFELQNINALSLHGMYLDSTISLHMTWNDPRLRWEPSEFGHIRQIKVIPLDHVWVPNLLIGKWGSYSTVWVEWPPI